MKGSFTLLVSFIGLASAVALPKRLEHSTDHALAPRALNASCTNTPTSRGCWGNYDIDTNYYEKTPDTGVTREYWLYVQNTTLAPDGFARKTLNFNGTIPGPPIIADWGDNLVIHVTNNLENNGTSVHWHGMRQLHSNGNDGVPGVTQCPIAPGDTMTYRFRATEYGSSWYHSHFTLQYGEGLFGPIIINGPATADYDEDLGVIALSDWSHKSVFELWDNAQTFGYPPALDNGLINGLNTFADGGSRYETVFKPGTKYRIRILNAAVEAHFRFAIDHHTFTVIANDFVPIVPYETDNVIISMGQRYDLIVEANQKPDNYWLRAIWQSGCNNNSNPEGILGVVRYDDNSTSDPTTISAVYPTACGDEPYESLVPHLALDAGMHGTSSTLNVIGNFTNVLHWTLNSSYMYANWSAPTNLRVVNGDDIFPTEYNVWPLQAPDQWVYWVINDQSGFAPYHPMHLHGHDAYVLAQGNHSFSPAVHALNFKNPPRRDTVSLAAGGHLVIGFKTDNPGSWLLHCHVAWHASEGFSVQFVERQPEIMQTIQAGSGLQEVKDACAAWDGYWDGSQAYQQTDAGI